MHTIEIDFDVFKELTMLRDTEEVTYNDVLRKLLDLDINRDSKRPNLHSFGLPWVTKNVTFPHGTKFRCTYKGKTTYGSVENGSLVVNGESFSSPSKAAMSIAESSTNGWHFWECQLPGQNIWKKIIKLRN